jgi:hypothetical protein
MDHTGRRGVVPCLNPEIVRGTELLRYQYHTRLLAYRPRVECVAERNSRVLLPIDVVAAEESNQT